MEKILITGGAGFIGSNLCDYFLSKGYYVRVLDNFSTGFMRNINEFINNSSFELIEGDIRDLATCQKACLNIDYVLHEAALGSVPRSVKDPITTNEVNVSGFLNMLVAAKDNCVKRFVYAASSSTYGDSTALPKIENNIGKPLSPYGVTKYVNELYADVFHKIYRLESIGLRYFNVFGQKQDPNGIYSAVIPKFVIQYLNHEEPLINGDGAYSRDFTYIDNVLLMNYLAITTQNPLAVNNVYNTAVGENISLSELAILLRRLLTFYDPSISEVEIRYGPPRIGDIPHSLASIEKAKRLLGYEPIYNVEDGLKKAVEWYWNNYK